MSLEELKPQARDALIRATQRNDEQTAGVWLSHIRKGVDDGWVTRGRAAVAEGSVEAMEGAGARDGHVRAGAARSVARA